MAHGHDLREEWALLVRLIGLFSRRQRFTREIPECKLLVDLARRVSNTRSYGQRLARKGIEPRTIWATPKAKRNRFFERYERSSWPSHSRCGLTLLLVSPGERPLHSSRIHSVIFRGATNGVRSGGRGQKEESIVGGPNHLERLIRVGKRFGKGSPAQRAVGDWAKGAENVSDDVETVQLLLEEVARKRGRNELSPKGVDGQIPASRKVEYCQGDPRVSAHFHAEFRRPLEPEGRTLQMLRQEVQGTSSEANQRPNR